MGRETKLMVGTESIKYKRCPKCGKELELMVYKDCGRMVRRRFTVLDCYIPDRRDLTKLEVKALTATGQNWLPVHRYNSLNASRLLRAAR
jgi:hypothetical protein